MNESTTNELNRMVKMSIFNKSIHNNLFALSPKELSVDAFMGWLFNKVFDQDSLVSSHVEFLQVFKIPIGKENAKNGFHLELSDRFKKVKLQEGKRDLTLYFWNQSTDLKLVVFENKFWTFCHGKQLETYKAQKPEAFFIYHKLGHLCFSEIQHVQSDKLEFELNDYHTLLNAITVSQLDTEITQEFKCFLEGYICQIHKASLQLINGELKIENLNRSVRYDSDVKLITRQFQHKFLSELHEKLSSEESDFYNLEFKPGTNVGGRPWTQLNIIKHTGKYGPHDELLFWRLDIRSGREYVRLNQYANTDKEHLDEKKERLQLLRDRFIEIIDGVRNDSGLRLKLGILSNRGIKESEVGIFYLDENPVLDLRTVLPRLSREISMYFRYMLCGDK